MNNDQLSIAAIRATCIDGINKAKSGHPGMALGSAPILYTLYTRHLVSSPVYPNWINRDRFVLSAGHASMLLYTILHMAGYQISIDDLKSFRQLDSLTPGHPEFAHTPGVDATSGPLGQGIAQAVGMAMAERTLAALYTDGNMLFNHYTYALCGDGCLEEGLSQEAIALAGVQKLNKLIVLYDSNKVTLDGNLDLSSNENTILRFKASNWNVLEVKNGNDVEAIDRALKKAKKSKEKPTLIIVHTIIGYGSKNENTCKVHGAPLGDDDGAFAKEKYGYTYAPFEIPETVYEQFKNTFITRGNKAIKKWTKTFKEYKKMHLEDALKIEETLNNDVSKYVFKELPHFEEGFKDSTRNTSQAVLNLLNKQVFNLVGGSADVAKSVCTIIKDEKDMTSDTPNGRNINFGIREFAMASAQNGMLLHGGLRTYVGCFLVFSDYMKSAIRMAALSKLPAIYLFSHDSIAVGEDGPTHQPIEHLAMLRSMPGLNVLRPCDAIETAASWKLALLSLDTPNAIILSRQNLPLMKNSSYEGVSKGGYIIEKEFGNKPDAVVIATGSEVSLASEAKAKLYNLGIDIRVVSMPSQELFLKQDKKYQEEVLGKDYDHRISVEMLTTFGWARFARFNMGIDTYGTSAPANDAIKSFGFTSDALVDLVRTVTGR
ncbi:MAG: transketolase [Erysipelotrichales bacterium]|nr:transketolase [Erysipelotrichales bacterium]